MGKSGSVSCGVTAPFSWVLVHTKFCLYPPRVRFPSPVLSSGGSMMGLMATSSKRAYAIPRAAAPRAPCSCSRPLLPCTSTGHTQTCKGRTDSVSVGSPAVHKVLFEPSKHFWLAWDLTLNVIFSLPIILLGLLLCPWM